MRSVTVGSEAAMDIEGGRSAGNNVEHPGRSNGAQHLSDYIRQQIRGREALARDQSDGYRGIEMGARDMSDGESHGEDGESERQGYACESNAKGGECRGQDRGPASAEDQPECSKEFRRCAFTDGHERASFNVQVVDWALESWGTA